MTKFPKFLNPQVLAELQSLELRARTIVDGFVSGRHRSNARGFSTEFTEHRPYVIGDDWRYIDWRLFGRTDKYFLKQFEDESNLSCYFALDTTKSMTYQGPAASLSKLEYAQCLLFCLGWLALKRDESIGLIAFGEQIHHHQPCSSHASILQVMARLLAQVEVNEDTNCALGLDEIAYFLKRRSVLIILSDFLDPVEKIATGIAKLKHAGHDVMAVQIMAPAEIDFPFQDNRIFRGIEQAGELQVDAGSIRQQYRKTFAEHCERMRKECLNRAVDFWPCRTDQSLAVVLSKILAPRMQCS